MLVVFWMISSKLNGADRCRIVRPLIVGLFLYRFQALSGGFWNHIGVVLRLAGYHIIRLRMEHHIIRRTTYGVSHSKLWCCYHIRASLQRVIGLDGWWLLLLYKSILLCGKYTIYSMHLAPPACKRGLYPPRVTRTHNTCITCIRAVFRPPCTFRRRI